MATTDTGAAIDPTIEAYRFHEEPWTDYDELAAAFEWEVPDHFNTATYVCDRWAQAQPDRVAMVAVGPAGGDTEYTFGQLLDRANRLANYLSDRGVGAGDRIAVSGSQRFECLVSHVAAWKLGAISVPISVRFGPDGLAYRLVDSGAVAFVATDPSLAALDDVTAECEALETVLAVGDAPLEGAVRFEAAVENEASEFETARTDADAPATIIYTSGTTGDPKGAVHAHRTLLGMLPSHVLAARNLDIRDDDLLYSPAEWSWVGPFYQGILPALYYGTPVLGDADPEFDPERVFDLTDRYGITFIGGATTVYRSMMQVPEPGRYDLSSLRVVLGAGEPLGQTVVEWWRELVEGVAVHEAYGQTEAGVFVGDCEALGAEHRAGRMGRPVPGYDVQVVDPQTRVPVDDEEVGEIALRYDDQPGSFLEYWNDPVETDAKVGDGWLYTEDLGSWTADEYLSYHSRTDDVINSSGYRIAPAEIEDSLTGHEAVANAGVIGVPAETRGEIPKAFVVPAADHEPTAELRAELQRHVKDRLAKHEYPRDLEFVDELPLTTSGKVRRQDLRAREGLVDQNW